jgi:hypothetical protein
VERDSSVGIATLCGLDGPRIESRWGARFSAPFQTGSGAHPASSTNGTRSLPGVKRPGRCVDHPPPSGAEVKERVELYIYYSFGPLRRSCRVNFTFTDFLKISKPFQNFGCQNGDVEQVPY